jgi:hypothetical protein
MSKVMVVWGETSQTKPNECAPTRLRPDVGDFVSPGTVSDRLQHDHPFHAADVSHATSHREPR